MIEGIKERRSFILKIKKYKYEEKYKMFLLMKKDKIVAITNEWCRKYIVINRKHMPPLGLLSLYDWRKNRSIPDTWHFMLNIQMFSNAVYSGIDNWHYIAMSNYALSLKDDYWIVSAKEYFKKKPKWKDINFFTNPFEHGVRFNHFVYCNQKNDDFPECSKISPDNTLPGAMSKFWSYEDGEILLCKFGASFKNQLSAKILNDMRTRNGLKEVKYVKYENRTIDGYDCFASKCFTNENLSYVELPFMLRDRKKCSIQDVIKQFSYVDGFKDYLEFIILNTFLMMDCIDIYDVGFLCNEKNKIVGVAPVMDAVRKSNDEDFTPFTNTKEELIEFIKGVSWFNKEEYKERMIAGYRERYSDNNLFNSVKCITKSLNTQLNKI